MLLALLLAGCASVESTAPSDDVSQSDGSLGPVPVVISFFEDLRAAIKNPELSDADTREKIVDRLAGYFAPNERDDQRQALATALAGLVRRQQLREGRAPLTIDLRPGRFEKISDDGERALVRLVDAHLVLVYATERGNDESNTVPVEEVLGRSDIPVVRIGNRWFLTED